MIETYAFAGAFVVQILATSVLYPAWFIRYLRARTRRLPADRLALVYPGVDVLQTQERFLKRYRALNTVIAVLGLLLLGGLFNYMRSPEWNDRPVELLVSAYSMVAFVVPIGLVVWLGARFNREYMHSLPATRRKALLERRGLFDFVSPLAVALAALSYLLFAAFVLYLRQHPFPGFAGLINLVGITLVYAVNALVVYVMLYGKSRKPLDTHVHRLHGMSVAVKSSVYSCIVIAAYLSLNLALGMLDLPRWEPFVLSVFFITCALLTSMGVMAPLRQPEAATS